MRAAPAPAGMRVYADPTLRRDGDGRTVSGGSPPRVMRLTDAGARRLDAWLEGEPVDDGSGDRRLLRRLLDASLVHPIGYAAGRQRAITAVVPVHDDVAGLERLLAGLGQGHRVIVIDDGSADSAAVRSAAEVAGATCHRTGSVPAGPGPARNHGLERVDTELVAFVDADVTVTAGGLDLLVDHFEDPEVVAVAPRVLSRDGTSGALTAHDADHGPLDQGSEPSPVGPGRRVSYVPTACLVVRTAVARELGGFDPDLRWGEDVDFVWRLVSAGHTVRYDPAVVVSHRPRPDLWSWVDQRRRYGTSAAPLAARHGSAVAPVRCSPWSAVAWLAVAAGHPAVGFGVGAASTASLASRLAHVEGGPSLALRLGARGHLLAGLAIARAIRRPWWPVAVALGATSGRLRRRLLSAVVVSVVVDRIREPRSTGALRTVGLDLADDLAYGFGVWEGMWRERSWAAILPATGGVRG